MVTLLKECGYNLDSTLSDFNIENVHECESYIDQNLRGLIDQLICCNSETYQNQTVFKFLPAHRNFLLGLSAKIKLMKQSVRSKKRVKKSQPNQMIEEDPEVPQAEVHGEYFLLCFFIAYREF